MTAHKIFYPKPGKKFCVLPRTVRQAVAVMPLAAKVLKRVKLYHREYSSRFPRNVKTAAPEING